MRKNMGTEFGSSGCTGLEALKEVLSLGGRVIGVYPSGAYVASGEEFSAAFTDDPATVEALWNGFGDSQGRGEGEDQPLANGRVMYISPVLGSHPLEKGLPVRGNRLRWFGTHQLLLPLQVKRIGRGDAWLSGSAVEFAGEAQSRLVLNLLDEGIDDMGLQGRDLGMNAFALEKGPHLGHG
jgi:hypothetical protein